MFRLWLRRMPLRLRLTVWYTLVLGLILLLFAGFIYVQVRRSLIAQMDAALDLAADQALIGVAAVDGRLAFGGGSSNPEAVGNLRDDFVIFLLGEDFSVVDTLSNEDELPQFSGQEAGFQTLSGDDELWRVYLQPVEVGGFSGWIQVSQEMDPVYTTLAGLEAQIAAGLPLAMLLAWLGGLFLASRALRPIDDITRTAEAISSGALDRRLNYKGPVYEVGRLARTFDSMLDWLQAAFVRERRFTGDAAHELRTPLTALKGQIGVTLSQSRNTAVYQDTLADMEGQVDRLIRLSNDLLFMARLDQGQYRPQRERIGLADFMGAVVDQIRPLAAAKSIEIEAFVPTGLAISADMDLLIRLFLNLLDNAVKYTPEKGRVSILAGQTGALVEIKIIDTGPGIAADYLPQLFERFYRVEGDRARLAANGESGGAGLGLAIANEIVRINDGRLTVESEVGVGTTFTVTLPISKGQS